MAEKTQKRYQLWGRDLKIGLQAILEKPVESEVGGATHDNPSAPIMQDYQLAAVSPDGPVLFSLREYDRDVRWKLEFARKAVGHEAVPRLWMVAGRFNEPRHFGFSSIHSNPDMQENAANRNYLRLAYPSVTGGFIPLYIKVEEFAGRFTYLLVEAEAKDECSLLVTTKVVEAASAPPMLVAAKKRLTYAV